MIQRAPANLASRNKESFTCEGCRLGRCLSGGGGATGGGLRLRGCGDLGSLVSLALRLRRGLRGSSGLRRVRTSRLRLGCRLCCGLGCSVAAALGCCSRLEGRNNTHQSRGRPHTPLRKL